MSRCFSAEELTAVQLGETPRSFHDLQQEAGDCPRCAAALVSARLIEGRMEHLEQPPVNKEGARKLMNEIDDMIASFGEIKTPWGRVGAAVTPRGVARIEFHVAADDMAPLLANDGLIPEHAQSALDPLAEELDQYFAGERREFDIKTDLRLHNDFTRSVLERTSAIEPGSFLTYQQVAMEIGNPRAYRAVGNALGSNPIPILIPCHRVLASGGRIGGYGGGLPIKRLLLELEGVMLAPARD